MSEKLKGFTNQKHFNTKFSHVYSGHCELTLRYDNFVCSILINAVLTVLKLKFSINKIIICLHFLSVRMSGHLPGFLSQGDKKAPTMENYFYNI